MAKTIEWEAIASSSPAEFLQSIARMEMAGYTCHTIIEGRRANYASMSDGYVATDEILWRAFFRREVGN